MGAKVLKFKYLLLTFLICSTISGYSQDIRFGITANPGMTWVKPDNQSIESDGVRFAFDFGLMIDYVFGDQERYAFNTGVTLNVAGAKMKGMATDTSGHTSELTARINYLELPVTIKLRSNEVGYFVFYGQIGMVPAFAVRARADYKTTLTEDGNTVTLEGENIKFENIPFQPMTIEKVRAFNMGLVVEAGFEYNVGEATVLVGGLYFNTGFLDMFKDGDGERIVPRTMGFRLGVMF